MTDAGRVAEIEQVIADLDERATFDVLTLCDPSTPGEVTPALRADLAIRQRQRKLMRHCLVLAVSDDDHPAARVLREATEETR